MKKVVLASLAASSLAVALGGATPAAAATSVDTPVTFSIAGGALAISAPAGTVNLGTGPAAGTLSAQLGNVTVTDSRAALGGSWTATVSTTTFTNSSVPAAPAVPMASVEYWSGAATASTGVAVTAPGQPTAASKVALSTSVTAFAATTTSGNNSTTWNPTLIVNAPAQAIAGNYTGTVTHSVA